MSFANNIRFLRKQRNISQEELAEMVGYKSFTTIQKWGTGDSEPNMGVLRQLADIFHLSISELVETDLENKSSMMVILPSSARTLITKTARSMLSAGALKSLHRLRNCTKWITR